MIRSLFSHQNFDFLSGDATYPAFQFERVRRTKLAEFATRIISFDTHNFARMVYTNLSNRFRTKRGGIGRGSEVVRGVRDTIALATVGSKLVSA